jgi:hypothetical protein
MFMIRAVINNQVTADEQNVLSWMRPRIAPLCTVLCLAVGAVVLITAYNVLGDTICPYTRVLMFPLLFVSIGAVIASIVSAARHSWWWLIATLGGIFILLVVLGTFEGC